MEERTTIIDEILTPTFIALAASVAAATVIVILLIALICHRFYHDCDDDDDNISSPFRVRQMIMTMRHYYGHDDGNADDYDYVQDFLNLHPITGFADQGQATLLPKCRCLIRPPSSSSSSSL